MPIFLPRKMSEKYTLILLQLPILIAKSISAIGRYPKRLDMTGVVLHLEVKVKSTIIVKSCTAVIFLANLKALGRQKR